ncbi:MULTISPECIES: SMC-Scp complex subunit ScpB [unclassified Enterococcus]|uniref:SMC-Scp complex subunit ScpB n=1 Tax=unclassified Enterococcus TaxID=2608891 RepID=UPI001552E87E|nr:MULTISPECIES: SMC-Scp complex subunit ScpB [unclassified Enterococcus]MBS7577385.1 SMC-Scp complex subunit ScpB [Enterococcus sp. MMGLQ5-2]MBS7584792.1 SMC-Scp complex subunit ScpB [Enterococcus sp. MMGLQ5-1]NPD12647.1 SMC-Scp complex subunit ScpB [Enterococcus sp. MMGLQ5-1]NPD37219.1 SMC-Scp complex subunit ScpB [Enterococcus sp. MMGLQ5-2]
MTAIGKIELLLFVAGEEGLTIKEIAKILGVDLSTVNETIQCLKEKYLSDQDSALTILEVAGRLILSTKSEYYEVIKVYAKTPENQKLSKALMETLSIIAYKQPITRAEIDEIRSVQSTGSISKLLLYGLIKDAGYKNAPGRPKLYQTTDFFLNFFGLQDLNELPTIASLEFAEDETNLFN